MIRWNGLKWQVTHLRQLRHQRPEPPINACLGSCFSAARLHALPPSRRNSPAEEDITKYTKVNQPKKSKKPSRRLTIIENHVQILGSGYIWYVYCFYPFISFHILSYLFTKWKCGRGWVKTAEVGRSRLYCRRPGYLAYLTYLPWRWYSARLLTCRNFYAVCSGIVSQGTQEGCSTLWWWYATLFIHQVVQLCQDLCNVHVHASAQWPNVLQGTQSFQAARTIYVCGNFSFGWGGAFLLLKDFFEKAPLV